MATFREYRESRYLTQAEAARLSRLSLRTVKRYDTLEIDPDLWTIVTFIEEELERDEHDIAPKMVDPFTFERMSRRSWVRLKVGAVFAAFGYFRPDQVQEQALMIARPDLWAFWREHRGERLVMLYRVTTSRYARDRLRSGYGVSVKDIRVPSLTPLSSFEPARVPVPA